MKQSTMMFFWCLLAFCPLMGSAQQLSEADELRMMLDTAQIIAPQSEVNPSLLEREAISAQLALLEIRVSDLTDRVLGNRTHMHGPWCSHGEYSASPYARLAATHNRFSTATHNPFSTDRLSELRRRISLLDRMVAIKERGL